MSDLPAPPAPPFPSVTLLPAESAALPAPEPFDPQHPLGKLALSLSGGDYRAAAFHLGTLRMLDRVGLLPSVVGLSTVSSRPAGALSPDRPFARSSRRRSTPPPNCGGGVFVGTVLEVTTHPSPGVGGGVAASREERAAMSAGERAPSETRWRVDARAGQVRRMPSARV